MQVASVIPKNQGHKWYFDNWYTSVNLQVELEKIGIHSLGTVRGKRLRGVFCSEKELKAKGRCTFEEKTTVVDNIKLCATVWLDNCAVTQHLYLLIMYTKLSALTENINLLYKSERTT